MPVIEESRSPGREPHLSNFPIKADNLQLPVTFSAGKAIVSDPHRVPRRSTSDRDTPPTPGEEPRRWKPRARLRRGRRGKGGGGCGLGAGRWQRRGLAEAEDTLVAGLGRWFGLRHKKAPAASRGLSGRLPLYLLVRLTPGYLGIIGSRARRKEIPCVGRHWPSSAAGDGEERICVT